MSVVTWLNCSLLMLGCVARYLNVADTYWRTAKPRWHAGILQHYRVISCTVTNCNIIVLAKRWVTYCNITGLVKSPVTCWHIATLRGYELHVTCGHGAALSCYSRVAYSVKWSDWRAGARFPAGTRCFLLSTTSRRAVGPTQSSVQWVAGAISLHLK
jgi:hypothetical protein